MSTLNPASPVEVQPDRDLMIVDANIPYGMFDLRELWRYRELIWIFAVRDIKVRYRQTLVGIAWTVLQPLAQMIAFNGLIQILKNDSTDGDMRKVRIFGSLLLYQLFAGILAASTLCLVDNRQMVTKVYFPRVILPLSACLRPLLDFGIGLIALVVLMFWFRVPVSATIFLSTIIVLLTIISGIGIGLWLSALNAHYRDFGYIVPFLLQLGMIASPVLYPSSLVPERWQWIYYANPMSTLLDGFRWTLFDSGSPPAWYGVTLSLISLSCLLLSGAWYFRRVECFLADNI